MAIEIPNSVTKIGDYAFYNRVKVTGLNIQGMVAWRLVLKHSEDVMNWQR